MRNLLIGIGILLVVLVGALFVVPGLVGADQLTAFLTERLRGATGYNVVIRGPVALSVLPSPHLTVADIQVLDGRAPDGVELARAGTLDIHVALLPLVAGRVEVTAVTVRDPVVSWGGASKSERPAPQGPAQPASPTAEPAPTGRNFSVAVRHIQVVNGSVAYAEAGRVFKVEHLDLDLETAADGALSGTADTLVRGDALHADVRLGTPDCARPVPLFLHATGVAGAAELDFAGAIRCDAGQPGRADGKLTLAAASALAALAPFAGGPLPPALDCPLALDGTLGIDRVKAEIDDLALDLDQSHGVGLVTAVLADRPSVDLTLDFNRLDLDKWLTKTVATAPPPATTTAPAGNSPPPAPASAAPGLPPIHIGLDLSSELLSWRGMLIRQARFNGGIDRGTVTVNQATAEMPAGTDFSISGQIADAFASPHFVGTVDAGTDDLRTVAHWAGLRLDTVPADRLRQASLSTSLDLAADRATATGVDLELDGSRFHGAANLMFGPHPAIGLRLAGDQLNLDAYLPPSSAIPVAPVMPPAGAVSAPGVPGVMPAAPPVPAAANLDLTLDSLTWRGQLLKGVHLAGSIENGTILIRDARIDDLNGGRLALSGRWSAGTSAGTLAGQLSASGPNAAALLALAGLAGQDAAVRLGTYRLDLEASGTPAALDLDGTLEAQDGHLTAKGRLTLPDPQFIGDVTLNHPQAARVLALVAPLYRPAGGTLGAMALSVGVDASAGRVAFDRLSLDIGGQRISGMATLDRTVHPARLDAALSGADLMLDPFLPARDAAELAVPVRYAALGDAVPLPGPWSKARIDLGWLGLVDAKVTLAAASTTIGAWQFDKPAVTAALTGGMLRVDRLAAGLFGGTVAAHGSLGSDAVAALALTLAGTDLDLKELAQHLGSTVLTAGTVTLDVDVTAAGGSQAALIASLGGRASLAAKDGGVSGLDLKAIGDRLAALKQPQDLIGLAQAIEGDGTTPFSTLDATATVANGVVRSSELRLVAEGGDLTGDVTADLPAWTIDGHAKLALAGAGDLPPLALRFEGPLDHPAKKVDVKALAAAIDRQGVANLIEGLAGTQPAAPASPSQQQQKPAQQLRNLFKGLVKQPNP